MSLLTICQGLALNVGLESPTAVINGAREMLEAKQFCEETCNELARRVDWGDLTKTATLTGDGSNKKHSLPAAFSRLVGGVCVTVGGAPVRPLSRAEWGTLTAVQGTPRYFLLEDNAITLWPYLATASTAAASYQSGAWCSNGGASFLLDSDESLIDEGLVLLGLIARWRRQKGMPYQDEEAEFEAALAQYAQFDDRARA